MTAENVRLLIWDLDDTFWKGTLEEGGCSPIPENLEIVRTLNRRGIISSICSKNVRERVLCKLAEAGILEEFVFLRVAFQPKGAMVRSIITSAQLRPESVMFLDDTPANLEEVQFYNPGIQSAGPQFIASLLRDPRFHGKNDETLSRLRQYKVLEEKELDRSRFVDGANEFLRQSRIRLSFHYDVVEQFDRIHELVNRSVQLNFTKERLAEDVAEAKCAFEEKLGERDFHAAYVKVSDRYGDYGVCGFYATKPGKIVQFVFSCRIMNMGVEQFIFRRLGNLKLAVAGEVASDYREPARVDWIEVVPDATDRSEVPAEIARTVCIRGACELDQATHYLRHLSFSREFTYPFRGWSIAQPLVQFDAVREAMSDARNAVVFDRLPGLQRRCIESAAFTGAADGYVLSFSLEPAWGNYRYRETGMIVPLRFQDGSVGLGADITTFSYEQIKTRTKVDMETEEWQWFLDNFEYVGHFDRSRFSKNLDRIFGRLKDKTVVVIQLNTRFGKMKKKLLENAMINDAARAASVAHNVVFVELDELIGDDSEALSAHHFERPVYLRVAMAISAAISSGGKPNGERFAPSAFHPFELAAPPPLP